MLRIVPHFAEHLGNGQDRTLVQLAGLGVPAGPAALRSTVVIQVPAGATPGRRLCAAMLIDYLVRLDPLIGAVVIDAADGHGLLGDLAARFPIEVGSCTNAPVADVVVSVGGAGSASDLVLDAAGWLSGVGTLVGARDDGNPIGALGTAALGAGEVFKLLFQRGLPALPFTRRLVPHRGVFSFYSYRYDHASPALPSISLDTILVGAGGVGAGVLVALAHLAGLVSGTLVVVDPDSLDMDSLNRVTYSPLAAARSRVPKVAVARHYVSTHAPALQVLPVEEEYMAFSRRISARRDRRYPLVITALDDDDVRWQVQRDLPRTLVDAATGVAANCRVERVLFGQHGCIGCSRPPGRGRQQIGLGERCGAPPDPHAPSISFVSAFAGTLAAAEVIKLLTAPDEALAGYFEHVFLYQLNTEQAGVPGFRPDCPVDCRDQAVLEAYAEKWP